MSVFNFMETFFFISLGITFILILLLVYHFKQRLSNLEQKSDTMLDIVNNVVKEMGVIKVLASSRPVAHPLSAFMDNQRPLNEIFSKMSMNNIEVNEVNINENDVSDVQEIHLAEPVEMDSDDEEEDSDDEAEYSDDEEEDAEEEHDQDDEKVVVSDDEEELEQEELVEEEMEQEEETVEEEVKVIQEVEEVLEEQPIVVNKLEPEDVEVLSEESSEDPMEEYKKLAPAALKALIISKGYATDVAKMKKPQLLQILEENL